MNATAGRNGCRNDSANLNDPNINNSRGANLQRQGLPNRRNCDQGGIENPNLGRSICGRARFVEDNAIVDISAKGQETEFVDNSGSMDLMGSAEEMPATTNNNATVVASTSRGPPVRHLEEGECDDSNVDASAKRPRRDVGRPDDDIHSYVDQKFNALTKMVELERELSEKNRELDLLRAKGIFINRGIPNVTEDYDNNQDMNERMNGMENETQLEMTIYRNAVQPAKRGRSSSEELVDTSNEMEEINTLDDHVEVRTFNFNDDYEFITEREIEKAKEIERDRRHGRENGRRDHHRDDRVRTNERDDCYRDDYHLPPPPPRKDVVAEKAKRLINEAEAAKARIYEVPGKHDDEFDAYEGMVQSPSHDVARGLSTLQMDEDYRLVATHIDQKVKNQIINHKYVDFAKLLPKNKLGSSNEDQQFMQIVNRDGAAGFMTVNYRSLAISSYG